MKFEIVVQEIARFERIMKKLIKQLLHSLGFEIRRIRPAELVSASPQRPIGNVRMFLEDIKARGFVPRGIIDVGANQGCWTRMALSVFPGARVIMIEPQQEMVVPLSKLIEEYPGAEHLQVGVGREVGERVQTIWPDLAGSSFLPPVDAVAMQSGRQRITKMVTIDDVLQNARASFYPDLVKLDIQGFELEALSGGQLLFGKAEVFILEASLFEFMEGQPSVRAVVDYMGERGYEVYDVTGFLRRPLDGALGQVDLAFVKSKGLLRTSNDW